MVNTTLSTITASKPSKKQRGQLFAVECPSRQVLQNVTSRWGVLVLVAQWRKGVGASSFV